MYETSKYERKSYRSINSDYTVRQGSWQLDNVSYFFLTPWQRVTFFVKISWSLRLYTRVATNLIYLHLPTQTRNVQERQYEVTVRLSLHILSHRSKYIKCFLFMAITVEPDSHTMREMCHFYVNNKLTRRMCPSKRDQVATKLCKLSNDGNHKSLSSPNIIILKKIILILFPNIVGKFLFLYILPVFAC